MQLGIEERVIRKDAGVVRRKSQTLGDGLSRRAVPFDKAERVFHGAITGAGSK
jgi:hypothetical protein